MNKQIQSFTNKEYSNSVNFLRKILEEAINESTPQTVSEKLGISLTQVKKLKMGRSAHIDTDKLLNFICEYMGESKITKC